ncbi:MAG TPA: MotA/TolQ/ExbB proton channel family protein [Candidatus Krumholzibacteria bacterium]|nr:MotA/TolQ/ExbB proton channel family protein [Candidatus Krumholzibacteria bacterium]
MPASAFLATMGPGELLGLVLDSTFFGKTIMLVLLVLSVLSWAVFIDKARTLARLRAGHLEFWGRAEQWLDARLPREDLVAWCAGRPDLPLCNLMREADGLTQAPAVRRASERVTYLEIEGLERYLILLSTAVTIAPFLGLLGTVWGIMTSFWDMSAMQSANLTVVAPGIAEALVTTIGGLATAIPAVIFYNSLVRKIDLVANELDRLRTILEESASESAGGRDRVNRPAAHDRGAI